MKQFYQRLIACGFGAVVLSSAANAQDASTSAQTNYGQLADLISQISILKAQVQVMQLKKQISDGGQTAGDAASAASTIGGVPSFPTTSTASKIVNFGIDSPQIVSISGRGGRLNVVLLMPGGSEVNAVEGTVLGNGDTVRFISPQTVEVSHNGKLKALSFVSGGGAFTPGE